MSKYGNILIEKKAEKALIEREIEECAQAIDQIKKNLDELKQEREILNVVMLSTQTKIKVFLEEVVTLALQTVFGGSYSFQIEYNIKRNKSEATLSVIKDNEAYDPKDELGGGIVDVASFALRIALWALEGENSEPVFILDEPSRNISRDKVEAFGEMLRKLSDMFSIQIIQVSHDPALTEISDKSFLVTQRKGISSVEEL